MKKIIRSLFAAIVISVMGYPIGTVHPATTTTITVNSTDDSIAAGDNVCTLREAIIAANTNQRSGLGDSECDAGNAFVSDTIIVPPGTYTLAITGQGEEDGLQGDLDIATSMTIQGASPLETIIQGGATSSDSVDRIFHVNTLGTVHFEGLTIMNGNPSESSSVGGGMLIQNSSNITIDNCSVRDNELTVNIIGGGSGIAHTGSGTLSIANSAIYDNQVSGSDAAFGGGIYVATQGILNIANTTLHRNTTSTSGGGLYNLGEVYLSNVTMTSNKSDANFNGIGDGGGIAGTGTTVLKKSILMNVDSHTGNYYPDISGNVQSADYNIIVDLGDEQGLSPAEHDIIGDSSHPVDPDLGEYIYSSGSHQLLSTSLVLDQIPTENCKYHSGGVNPLFQNAEQNQQDQRGALRSNGSYCDIGAREFFSLSVTSTQDALDQDGKCTLREAITTANTGASSGQTAGECDIPADKIFLPAGTYTLAIEGTGEDQNLTGDLNVRIDLILAGAGAQNTIIQAGPTPGSGIDRVLNIYGGRIFEIHDLKIRYGQTDHGGGGIRLSNSRFTMIDASISDNTSDELGGGIYCAEFCTLVITGSSVVHNQSRYDGGGIYVSESSLTIANSTISNNQAARNGGGISGDQTLYLSNTTVTANIADSDQDGSGNGGGVSFITRWNLKNSIISSNIDHGGELPDAANSFQEITSLDYNLIGDIGTQAFTAAAHDIVGTSAFPEDPKLGDLTGTPAYQVPEAGSQVIDAIPAFNCTYTSSNSNPLFSDGDAITSDQIGGIRPEDGDEDGHYACDIGAVEYTPPEHSLVYLPIVVNE